MKKSLSLLLVCALLVFAMPCALADSTTTLTTTVPASATYTLNIPADQAIAYGATRTDIGSLTVSNSSGFAVRKNLDVTITYGDFISEDVDTTIPMKLYGHTPNSDSDCELPSGCNLTFKGNSSGILSDKPIDYQTHFISGLNIRINSADWGKALGGDYTSTITFSAKVVVEE